MSFKDETQASDSENCILKQKMDIWELIILFSTMPPNAVTSPLLTLLYTEEMADQVSEMY